MEIETIIEHLRRSGTPVTPMTREEIRELVQFVGRRVPKSLVTWWSEVGSCKVGAHYTLAGNQVFEKAKDRRRCVSWERITVSQDSKRSDYWHSIMPFLRRDADWTYCLHLERQRGGDCPVVLWDTREQNQAEQFLALRIHHSSFVHWLAETLDIPPDVAPPRKTPTAKGVKVVQERKELSERATLARALQELTNCPGVELNAPASDNELEKMEKQLDVLLPESLRQLLKTTNGFSLAGTEVFPALAGRKIVSEVSLTGRTLFERSEGIVPLRKDLVPLCDEGNGDLLCVVCKADRVKDSPIVRWSHDTDAEPPEQQNPERVAPSLRSWLIQLILEVPAVE